MSDEEKQRDLCEIEFRVKTLPDSERGRLLTMLRNPALPDLQAIESQLAAALARAAAAQNAYDGLNSAMESEHERALIAEARAEELERLLIAANDRAETAIADLHANKQRADDADLVCDHANKVIGNLEIDLKAALARAEKLRTGLKRLEWCSSKTENRIRSTKERAFIPESRTVDACPACKQSSEEGHKPDCWLAELLK